jgi:hypothetical protein
MGMAEDEDEDEDEEEHEDEHEDEHEEEHEEEHEDEHEDEVGRDFQARRRWARGGSGWRASSFVGASGAGS